jgi:peptidoglycan/LPS O-acetylase OafA/YrhL
MVALYHPAWQSHIVRWNLVRNGSLMVDFFFVLSGFVLFHSYGGKLATWADSRRFLLIRLGRLYPLHLAVLLVFVGIECLKWGLFRLHLAGIASIPFEQNTPASLIGNLLLIHGLGFYEQPTWNVPSWSISVEFYIYALFALIVVLFRKKLFLLVSCAALAATGLLVSWTAAGGLDSTAKFGFFRGLLGFFCGVIAWHCYSALRGRFAGWGLAAAAILLAVSTIVLLAFMPRGPCDFLVIPLFVGIVLVVALADARGLGFLNGRALVWLRPGGNRTE